MEYEKKKEAYKIAFSKEEIVSNVTDDLYHCLIDFYIAVRQLKKFNCPGLAYYEVTEPVDYE